MKKHFHIGLFALLLSSYLLVHIGVPVFKHYCGGELESISAFVKANDCCGDTEEENSDCCDDEIEVSQLDQESVLSKTNKLPPIAQLFCFSIPPQYTLQALFVDLKNVNKQISPSQKLQQVLEVRYSVLRI